MTPSTNGASAPGKGSQPPTAGPPPTNARPPHIDPAILNLIRRPYLAEILTALDERPHTLTSLRRHTRAPRPAAIAALRTLAAHHAITRHPHPPSGSWDARGDSQTSYQLSPTGHALVERLLHLDVWQALFETQPSADTPDR
jgi:DNA-binding HxlR family transcriptional regulator